MIIYIKTGDKKLRIKTRFRLDGEIKLSKLIIPLEKEESRKRIWRKSDTRILS